MNWSSIFEYNFSLSQGHGGRLWKGRRQNTMIKSPALPWLVNGCGEKNMGQKGLPKLHRTKQTNHMEEDKIKYNQVEHWADLSRHIHNQL